MQGERGPVSKLIKDYLFLSLIQTFGILKTFEILECFCPVYNTYNSDLVTCCWYSFKNIKYMPHYATMFTANVYPGVKMQ